MIPSRGGLASTHQTFARTTPLFRISAIFSQLRQNSGAPGSIDPTTGARSTGTNRAAQPLQYLRAARLFGSVAVAIVGQVAVNMPLGYLGPADTSTTVGTNLSIGLALATIALAIGLIKGRDWASYLTLLLLSITMSFFIPAMADDPIRAGLVVSWLLVNLSTHLFQTPGDEVFENTRTNSPWSNEVELWLWRFGPSLRHLAGLSMILAVAIAGFEMADHKLSLAITLACHFVTLALAVPFLKHLIVYNRHYLLPLIPSTVAAFVFAAEPTVLLLSLAVSQFILLVVSLWHHPVAKELNQTFFASPALFILLSFLGLIAIGTLLLSFPVATATGQRLTPLAALFMAVSSVCVTGLTVLDPGTQLSFYGQGVILLLIQLGGLGIMVLSTLSILLLGTTLGVRGEQALGDMLELNGSKAAYQLVYFIGLSTFVIEALGASFLTWNYLSLDYGLGKALWYGVFHAISAFCNAGFSLHSDSLIGFQKQPMVLGCIGLLIVAGGLGFVVLATLWNRAIRKERGPVPLHVKVVLGMTVLLTSSGAVLYGITEWNHSLASLDPSLKLVNALFQSVTLRTAGFNSVAFTLLQPASISFMVVFMFIGAAPGGTGGGVKVTTAAVLLAAVPALHAGKAKIILFRRSLAGHVVYRAAAITVVSLTLISVFLFLLLFTQSISYDRLLFEITSAFGTVGLSLGVTGSLDPFGRYLVIFAMFLGRVGPITAALVFLRRRSSRLRHPEEGLMVG